METLLSIGLSNAAAAAVLALGVALLSWPLRGHPALRHRLWVLVLLKLVTPPFWTVPLSLPSTRFAPETPNVAFMEQVELDASAGEFATYEVLPQIPAGPIDAADCLLTTNDVASVTPSWGVFLGTLWLIGSCVWLGVTATRIRRFQRLLETARPAGPDVQELVADLGDQIGLARLPRVYWVKGVVSPMLWAVFCWPRLILPMGLWARLDPVQRETLIVHELAHLRRRDHWVRALELVVTALYWWFPVVWWARHALRDAEETSCDAWVVWTFPGAARPYAETLVETLDFLSTSESVLPAAASGIGRVSFLKRRLTMIMQRTTPRRLTWSGMLFSLGVSAMLLPLAPSWAQVAEEKKGEGGAEVEIVKDSSLDVTINDLPEKQEHRVFFFKDADGGEGEVKVETKPPADHEALLRRLKELVEEVENAKDDQASKVEAKKALLSAIKLLQEKKTKEFNVDVKAKHDVAHAVVLKLNDAQKAELDKAQAEIKQLEAAVRDKEKELHKAAAELKQAHAKLIAMKTKAAGTTVFPRQVKLFNTKTYTTPNTTGPKAAVEFLPKRGPVSPEQEARMAKIEVELKRLSEELAKLREEPAKREK